MRFEITYSKVQFGWAALPLAVACFVGCETDHGPVLAGNQGGQEQSSQRTPEESFQNIVSTLKRAISDQPQALVSSTDSGYSRLQYHRELEHKLTPPSEEGDRYKGTITMITDFSYRFRPADESDPDDDEAEEKSGSKESEGDFDIGDPGGDPLGGLGSDINIPSDSEDEFVPRSAGAETEDTETKTYEFEYRDDRWVLVTRIDPAEEQFASNAFEYALKHQ